MQTQTEQDPLLGHIRQAVKNRLVLSPAYRQLSADKQRQIAHDTVNALRYIVGGQDGRTIPRSMTLAGNSAAFAGNVASQTPAASRTGAAAPSASGKTAPVMTKQDRPNAMKKQDRADRQNSGLGEAARAGGEAFTDIIADVNFPAFVGGLIDGVFNSIVTTSIKQMEAYAEMVKNVSKSVDQYMKDNVTENHARDYLAEKYPEHLAIDINGDSPKLTPKEGADDSNLPDFFADLGLKAPVTSLDEDVTEQELVPAARRRIAMDRQQLLATMVMMGVNRLVVTNGTIEASCLFELDTTDIRKNNVASVTDLERSNQRQVETGGEGSAGSTSKGDGKWSYSPSDEFSASSSWSYQNDTKNSWYSKSSRNDMAKFKMHTTSSRSDETTINMHAQLAGKVKVNFKSDYFPMEKMIDAFQVQMIQEKTSVGVAPRQTQQPLPPPPPPPPMPALPAPAPAPAAPVPAAPRT
jgi:hypothetical protein